VNPKDLNELAERLSEEIVARLGVGTPAAGLARMIDHTILRPDATRTDVLRVCEEARRYGFASVCVNSYWAGLVASELAGTDVATCAVVGFPLGAASTEAKRAEAEMCLRVGARELDMVMNVGALKSGDLDAVRLDILAVTEAAQRYGAIVKVILETCLLTNEEKVTACKLATSAGAGFVKTSTGFGSAGATEDDVRLMRATVGTGIGVKASGGIRTRADAQRMIAAGANRIGASASVKIVEAPAE
jgi:deoxyribose-phosphate aldolase